MVSAEVVRERAETRAMERTDFILMDRLCGC